MRITKAQYKGLDGYKYSGTDKSVVSRYILGPFWNWLVLLFPTNLAPNMVCPHLHLNPTQADLVDHILGFVFCLCQRRYFTVL
jgi:hypothetical protein